MALLACKECGNQVSSTATACPQCGAPVKVAQPARKVDLKTLLVGGVFCFLALYFYFRDSNSTDHEAAPVIEQPKTQLLKPGDIVKVPAKEFGCMTKADLVTVDMLIRRGEQSMILKYFPDEGDGRCRVLDQKNTYRVISVELNSTEFPNDGIIYVTDTNSNSATQVWTKLASLVTANAATSGIAKTKALPFKIETVVMDDSYKDDLKRGSVNVEVSGGTRDEWVATGIAIAKKVATLGADSIDVTINRDDFHDVHLRDIYQVRQYQTLATVSYSPNKNHAIWPHDFISLADRKATLPEIAANTEFEDIRGKLSAGNAGMDYDKATKKAEAIVIKKYNLPKDWTHFPWGANDSELSLDKYNVDDTEANPSLDAIDACMRGKIINSPISCEN
jgi:hypothetical protein